MPHTLISFFLCCFNYERIQSCGLGTRQTSFGGYLKVTSVVIKERLSVV